MNYSKDSIIKKHKTLVSTGRKLSTKLLINFFRIFVLCILLVGAVGISVGLGVVSGILEQAPDASEISIAPSGVSTTIYDCEGNEIEKLVGSGSNRIPVSIDQIPECLQLAFVDIEDERFYEHNGIDAKGIVRAGVSVLLEGDMQGASTITQQLLKNNVFVNGGNESSMGELVKRKLQEQYLALELEKVQSKTVILENYLNTINLGAGCYGVQAASKRYFDKDVSELNVSESAVIAAITQNPTKYNPINHPEENAKRRKSVLDKMKENGHITEAEYEEAINDNVYDRIQSVNVQTQEDKSPYSYFVDELISQVLQDLQTQKGYTYEQASSLLYSGGLSIYSTQDQEIQEICDRETSDPANYPGNVYYSFDWRWSVQRADGTVENYSNVDLIYYFKNILGQSDFKIIYSNKENIQVDIDAFKAEYSKEGDINLGENILYSLQPQVSFTVMDQHTGYIKAIVGGRGEKQTSLSLNRATHSPRQPGSCFKILAAYAPAMDACGLSLATVFNDEPYNYENGRPVNNWNKGYLGLTTARQGIWYSMNILAVKAITYATPELAYEYLQNFGFTTIVDEMELSDGSIVSDINQATALGGLTKGVYNEELTAAYAAIANGGKYIEPVYYTKVTDSTGRIILESNPEERQVIEEETAYLLTDAMHDVVTVEKATGLLANIDNQYVAGKTGTSSDDYDIWFAGYTDYLTASIWSGFDENTDISKYCGNTSYHNKLWSKIMGQIHEVKGYTYREPERPESIVEATVCDSCGYLAVDGVCTSTHTELFDANTIPTESCKCHLKYTICTLSGKLAGEYCPKELQETKFYQTIFKGNNSYDPEAVYELPSEIENGVCILHTE
ncbi:MAG: transglycosylase domain-containing protein [Lachnospiraceae bacterium]|nr:transglycosylase domain-containing protein [Lachnospiraceae bacterium]